MTASYCLSSTRNTITHSRVLFLDSNLYLPNHRNHVGFTQEPKKDLILNIHKSSVSVLNTKNYQKFTHPFASLSASNHRNLVGFTQEPKKDLILNIPRSSISVLKTKNHHKLTHPFASLSESSQNQENVKEGGGGGEMPGMAQVFHISSNTASSISICIAVAALSLPIFMKTLVQGIGLKTKLLSYVTLLLGFYMAWNIGANDVANAMGTSVGSGALTLRQAVVTAAVLEFSGALLMGGHVTSTMQKGILVANVFQGKDSLLFVGLISSLAAAGTCFTWFQINRSLRAFLNRS